MPTAEEKSAKAEDYALIERARVINALFTFTTYSPDEECERRVAAVGALTGLCRLQECRGFRRRKPLSSPIQSAEEKIE